MRHPLLDNLNEIRFLCAVAICIAALVGIGTGLNDVRDGWVFAGVLIVLMVVLVSAAGLVVVLSVSGG